MCSSTSWRSSWSGQLWPRHSSSRTARSDPVDDGVGQCLSVLAGSRFYLAPWLLLPRHTAQSRACPAPPADRPLRADDAPGGARVRGRGSTGASSRSSRGGCRRGAATGSSPASAGCSTRSRSSASGPTRSGCCARPASSTRRPPLAGSSTSPLRRGSTSRGSPRARRTAPEPRCWSSRARSARPCCSETLVLSVLNHDSAVAAAGARMTGAAGGRPCIEMGSRRTHEQAAVAAARAAYIVGFAATSNLEAGRRYEHPDDRDQRPRVHARCTTPSARPSRRRSPRSAPTPRCWSTPTT